MSNKSPAGLLALSTPAAIGDTIVGKYRLDRILGSSGMGVVYGATHLAIETRVAVKFLLARNGQHDPDALVRFQREAKFTAKINSDHVVRVTDVGSLPSGTPFIVMEYLDGEDLACVAEREAPLPVERAIDFVLQACEGLTDAHAAGVIHRDLKPSNLFLTRTPDGREMVKIIDFGIAKYRGTDTNPQNESDSLTQTQVIVGSPRYMAPEQARASRDIDARADVWSLAIILQELLTGKPVFKGGTPSDSLVLILTQPAERVDQLRPDVPSGLADAITRALAKEVSERTASIAEFARELLPYASPTQQIVFEPSFSRISIPPAPRSFSDLSGPQAAIDASALVPVHTAVTRMDYRNAASSIPDLPGEESRSSRRHWIVPGLITGFLVSVLVVQIGIIVFRHATRASHSSVAGAPIASPMLPAQSAATGINPQPVPTETAASAQTLTASSVTAALTKISVPTTNLPPRRPTIPRPKPAPEVAPSVTASPPNVDLFDDPK